MGELNWTKETLRFTRPTSMDPSSVIETDSVASQPSSGPRGFFTSTPQATQYGPPFNTLFQLQYQQYLIQQTAAAQQMAAKAVTIESAKVLAAARAAEISKQLTQGGKDDSNDKKFLVKQGKGRSVSRSMSRSPLLPRSRSLSRSCTPISHRRRRSASRSPIRLRHDYYSSRNYYWITNRGYQNYYSGGHFDYPCTRERDYYSNRRSRSRVWRWSRTSSRSALSRRKRSVTPSPSSRLKRSPSYSPCQREEINRKEERKLPQTPNPSMSRELAVANVASRRTSPVRSISISSMCAKVRGKKEGSMHMDADRSPKFGEENLPNTYQSVSLGSSPFNNAIGEMNADHVEARDSSVSDKQCDYRNLAAALHDKSLKYKYNLDDWQSDSLTCLKESMKLGIKRAYDCKLGLNSRADMAHSNLGGESRDMIGKETIKALEARSLTKNAELQLYLAEPSRLLTSGIMASHDEDNKDERPDMEIPVFEGPKPASEDDIGLHQYPKTHDTELDGNAGESYKNERRKVHHHKRHKKKCKSKELQGENHDELGVPQDIDAHKVQRRHKRKHRKDAEHDHKEKKKHKHRYRTSRGDGDTEAYRAGKKKNSKHYKKSKHGMP